MYGSAPYAGQPYAGFFGLAAVLAGKVTAAVALNQQVAAQTAQLVTVFALASLNSRVMGQAAPMPRVSAGTAVQATVNAAEALPV